MPIVNSTMSISIDGYMSGPEHLDEGFYRVQDWVGKVFSWRERQGMNGGEHDVDSDIFAAIIANTGAYVMGRNMFDVGEEPWGDDPPFKAPVFVVTNRDRDVLERKGGTTFTFVTDGVESAVKQAKDAADDKNVTISGGANLVQQVIASDLLDELHVHIAPVLLGGGMSLFGQLPAHVELERLSVVGTPATTHFHYRFHTSPGVGQ